MSNNELNLNEMGTVAGGKGGSPTELPKKDGYIVYRIVGEDNLTKIAKRYGTTVKAIVAANPTLENSPNFIRAGFWIYVPVK
jgi:LysM repeat protein